MNSRERVLTTLQHKQPDKIPIDMGSMGSTGIMAIAYNRLKRELGLNNYTTKMLDVSQQLAVPEKKILDLFQVDIISLENSYFQSKRQWKKWILPDKSEVEIPADLFPRWYNDEWVLMDGIRVKARMPEACLYFENCNPPITSEEDLAIYNWKLYSDEYFIDLEKKAKQLYEETEYAIVGGFGGSIFEEGQCLRGYANLMMDFVTNPDFIDMLFQKIVEVHLINLEKYLQAVSKYVQVIQMGDDLGMQSGTQISKQHYRDFIKPYQKKLFKYVKNNSDLFLFLHSCGSIEDFLPDLIDTGIDILNPVQYSADNMDSQYLKNIYGERITFWGGGIDTQKTLPFGTPNEVSAEVERQIEILSPGGGFIFATVHNIQANVPTENIVKLFETVLNNRNY